MAVLPDTAAFNDRSSASLLVIDPSLRVQFVPMVVLISEVYETKFKS